MRRVAITGLGAVTPVGNDLQSTWDGLVAGKSGVDVIRAFDATDFPVNIAAEVKDFDATKAMSAKEVRRTSYDVHFAVAALRKDELEVACVPGYAFFNSRFVTTVN